MTTVLDLLKEEGIQEGIQQGIQKGIQEGIQQGVQRGRDETIVRLLQHAALSPQEIAAILGVDLSHVMGLAEAIKDPLSRLPLLEKNIHTHP